MRAFEFLVGLRFLPDSKEGAKLGRPSNGEIRRWLVNHAVIINSVKPLPGAEVQFPITDLVFFPNFKHKCTMVGT